MNREAHVKPAGTLQLTRLRALPAGPLRFRDVWRWGFPRVGELRAKTDAGDVARWRLRNLPHLLAGVLQLAIARGARRLTGIPILEGALYLERLYPDGRRVQLGLASLRVVTTAGAGFIVDAFQNLVELEAMNFHAFGTGAGAEAVGNTALTTELTTQYATDNVRPTGVQSENGAAVYRTVGTLDPDADVGITEHGVMSQAAVAGGVLLDRSLFGVVNLTGATGDAVVATYDFTINTGG